MSDNIRFHDPKELYSGISGDKSYVEYVGKGIIKNVSFNEDGPIIEYFDIASGYSHFQMNENGYSSEGGEGCFVAFDPERKGYLMYDCSVYPPEKVHFGDGKDVADLKKLTSSLIAQKDEDGLWTLYSFNKIIYGMPRTLVSANDIDEASSGMIKLTNIKPDGQSVYSFYNIRTGKVSPFYKEATNYNYGMAVVTRNDLSEESTKEVVDKNGDVVHKLKSYQHDAKILSESIIAIKDAFSEGWNTYRLDKENEGSFKLTNISAPLLYKNVSVINGVIVGEKEDRINILDSNTGENAVRILKPAEIITAGEGNLLIKNSKNEWKEYSSEGKELGIIKLPQTAKADDVRCLKNGFFSVKEIVKNNEEQRYSVYDSRGNLIKQNCTDVIDTNYGVFYTTETRINSYSRAGVNRNKKYKFYDSREGKEMEVSFSEKTIQQAQGCGLNLYRANERVYVGNGKYSDKYVDITNGREYNSLQEASMTQIENAYVDLIAAYYKKIQGEVRYTHEMHEEISKQKEKVSAQIAKDPSFIKDLLDKAFDTKRALSGEQQLKAVDNLLENQAQKNNCGIDK